MEYTVKKAKKGWRVFLIILAVILAVLTCTVSVLPSGVYIPGARFGVYGTMTGLSKAVPGGSFIITDRVSAAEEGSIVAVFTENGDRNYPDGMKSALVGRLSKDNGSCFVTDSEGNTTAVSEWQVENVSYYMGYIGYAAMVLYRYRPIMWSAWAVLFLFIIVWEATSGRRFAAKKRKALIKTFDFYGEKYDREEDGKDY